MTWKSFHNRGEILRAVISTANLRRDGILPMNVEGVRETFGDELTLLAALQLKWHTRLAGHIERELMSQPMDLQSAVRTAWGEAADELPGVRIVLDRYRDEPLDEAMALATAVGEKENLRLTGLMTIGPNTEDSAEIRRAYATLRELRDAIRDSGAPGTNTCVELSMGMTNDLPEAIAEGATIVRVGRALFGERK